MCQATSAAIHPFEKAGLGKAPFRYVGMVDQEISYGQRVIGSVGGIPIMTKPGGTCDYCGQYIVNMFNVVSADGHKFHVGCDCIHKVDARLEQAIKPDLKKMKAARDKARIEQARADLPNAHLLRNDPHPSPYHAEQGKRLWHYCEWLLKNGGTSGKLRAARMIEAAIAPIDHED